MSKYKNKKIEYDGIVFDSKKELHRYWELLELEKLNLIKQLQLQKKFVLQDKFKMNGKTIRAITYIADFYYYDNQKKCYVVEDVKGIKTEVYKIKKKLFQHRYGIDIVEL